MGDWKRQDFSKIDIPQINRVLFYPRYDYPLKKNNHIKQVMIPVGNGGVISSIWADVERPKASILFFHGNGELASEYTDIADLFGQMSIRFICVDYRGYGLSSDMPSISTMIYDAHDIFKYVLSKVNNTEELILIMGRSLGCASALEIAAGYSDLIDGLIIESGFAETLPLLKTLGSDPDFLGIKEEDGLGNVDKIKKFSKPLLIIHAEDDFLIPIAQAEKLFEASNSLQKKFLKIPNAGHNDIFIAGLKNYLTAVKDLISTAEKEKKLS
ncbi:MAG: alpha/beta fold hydrolase [Smithella sp.]